MKILVVDDEQVARQKMNKIMNNFGDCVPVSNGEDALKAFSNAWEEDAPFDLITLDISMPDKDGITVLTEIRELEKERKTPYHLKAKVMMVTAHDDTSSITASLETSCDTYVMKPFNKEMIEEKMEKIGLT